jgi:hypothetical protein
MEEVILSWALLVKLSVTQNYLPAGNTALSISHYS